MSLGEIARQVNAKLEGDSDIEITGAAPIETADTGEITFVANPHYRKYLEGTRAAAVILDETTPCTGPAVVRHQNPYLTFARIIDMLYTDQPLAETGIHPSAVIEDDVTIDSTAAIGPLCHICRGATIGKNSQLASSVYLGPDAAIGEQCLIYPGVRIMRSCRIGDKVIIHSSTVVGSDGFGFAESETGLKKIKQIGWVEIDDDVEIGSNCSIDRGALGPTRIGGGTKIDNLVQIAHNVEIGENSIIVSQVGISGSTKIGSGVILAGQAGLVGHIEIGDGAIVAAQSGIAKSVAPGKTMFGSPARDIVESRKIEAALGRLPQLLKRVRKLEEKLKK